MFPFLDCMRVNAFVNMKAHDQKLKHKDFIKDWIKGLLARAAAASLQVRRAADTEGMKMRICLLHYPTKEEELVTIDQHFLITGSMDLLSNTPM